MSGHNRWSKVKNIKGPADAKRGKIWSKVTKEIMVAAKQGGSSPDHNARLRSAILEAKANNMPKENIERAVKKGSGELQGEAIEECVYEGYGPGGVAIIVAAATDNKNRTVNDIRILFKTHGGHLGESGSVGWMFKPCGLLYFEGEKHPEDTVTDVALEAGAQDVSEQNGLVEVVTDIPDFDKVRDTFDRLGIHPTSGYLGYAAKSTTKVDKENAEKLLKFLEEIEDHDDVQRTFSNVEIDVEIMKQLSAT